MQSHLPFANYRGYITCILHHISKGGLVGRQTAKFCKVAVIVPSGHQRHSRWRTNRIRVTIGKANAFTGKFVQVGSRIG